MALLQTAGQGALKIVQNFRLFFWTLFVFVFGSGELFSISAFADTPLTAFYYTGSPLSGVTRGKTATVTPADGYRFSAVFGAGSNGYSDYVGIQVDNFSINQWWSVRLAAPSGRPLTAGSYLNATRFEDSTNPGLDFNGNGAGNNQLTGFFKILEVTVDNGQLVSFAADF